MPELPLSLILTSARKRKFLYGPLVLAIIDASPEPPSMPSTTSHFVVRPGNGVTSQPSVDLPSKREIQPPVDSWADAGAPANPRAKAAVAAARAVFIQRIMIRVLGVPKGPPRRLAGGP